MKNKKEDVYKCLIKMKYSFIYLTGKVSLVIFVRSSYLETCLQVRKAFSIIS